MAWPCSSMASLSDSYINGNVFIMWGVSLLLLQLISLYAYICANAQTHSQAIKCHQYLLNCIGGGRVS